MKIGIFGSAVFPAPSTLGIIYAPIKINYDLARFFSDRGHDVTFFGQTLGDDPFRVETFGFDALGKDGERPEKIFRVGYESLFRAKAYKYAQENGFDLMQAHNTYWTVPVSTVNQLPTVITIHDSTGVENYKTFYKYAERDSLHIVVPSQAQAARFSFAEQLSVIPHGIDVASMPFERLPGEYLVWAGRMAPTKGLHIAIEVAKRAGMQLKIAGTMGPFLDLGAKQYYEQEIQPHIDGGQIEYVGALSPEDTHRLFSKARALLFPTDGTETFGMILIEAMATGTPVVGFGRGPLTEIVVDGQTGFIGETVEDLVRGVQNAHNLDRASCRQHVEKHFSLPVMAGQYESLYQRVVS